jgi:Family of unknown function (DUF6178)
MTWTRIFKGINLNINNLGNKVANRREKSLWRSTSYLLKEIYDADSPEKFVAEIPTLSLYLLISQNGLGSSADLIEMAPLTKVQSLVDLDVWQKDRLSFKKLYDWLLLPNTLDATDSSDLSNKIFNSLDLKILAVLIAKNCTIVTFEDPTEHPPEAEFFTFDNGYTWININCTDSDEYLATNNLLNLLISRPPELIYQLLAVAQLYTPAILEEEAFNEREKRLAADGFPLKEELGNYTTHIYPSPFINSVMAENKVSAIFNDTKIAEESPLLITSPLETLINWVGGGNFKSGNTLESNTVGNSSLGLNDFEAQFNLLLNSALLRWRIDYTNFAAAKLVASQVKGAINIGLEYAMVLGRGIDEQRFSPIQIFVNFGLKHPFRLGLYRLSSFSKSFSQLLKDNSLLLDKSLAAYFEPFSYELPFYYDCFTSYIKNNSKFDFEDLKQESLPELEKIAFYSLEQLDSFEEWLKTVFLPLESDLSKSDF